MRPFLDTPSAGPVRSRSRALDQFYTRPEVARDCVARVRAFVRDLGWSVAWIEPSAGDGAFLQFLPEPRIGLDIAPARQGIECADFLTWRPKPTEARIVVVGNPPFGKNASVAVRFFNHAARFADIVAFVVPRTFQKDSTKTKLAQSMSLAFEMSLGPDGFLFDGQPYDVPTVFQVWRRDAAAGTARREPSLRTHPHFAFLRTPAEADFAFQRVGARAGLVSLEGLRKSPQSHYFIQVITPDIDVMAVLRSVDWSPLKHRTAGNPSIGKAELIGEYVRAVR